MFTGAQKLRTALRRGISFIATTDETCTLRADVMIARKLARRLGIARRIAQRQRALNPGGVALRAKPARTAVRSCAGSAASL